MKTAININATTDGKGKGTDEIRLVTITALKIGYSNQAYQTAFPGDPFAGELRAYFEPHGFTIGSWNVDGHGLIHGDRQWLKEFKAGLRANGFSIKAAQNVKYGEKILQGKDYVSMEVGQNFFASWMRFQSEAAKQALAIEMAENA